MFELGSQASPRADICIGTDSFHTPWEVRDAIVAAAEADGYSVAVDAPFSGALVPLSSYRKDHRILSVMIEVNRRLYMEEDSGKKKHGLGKVCATLGRLVMAAAEAAVRGICAGEADWLTIRVEFRLVGKRNQQMAHQLQLCQQK